MLLTYEPVSSCPIFLKVVGLYWGPELIIMGSASTKTMPLSYVQAVSYTKRRL